RLQRLTDSVKDLPVVDQAKVAELRDAINSGDYALDNAHIAEKLASFEAMLGTLGRG
ncbi:MAG: flagellar biosynthesis anti-sigma factor FlgM, partial [Gammaproteobacteria bacterium]